MKHPTEIFVCNDGVFVFKCVKREKVRECARES